ENKVRAKATRITSTCWRRPERKVVRALHGSPLRHSATSQNSRRERSAVGKAVHAKDVPQRDEARWTQHGVSGSLSGSLTRSPSGSLTGSGRRRTRTRFLSLEIF